MMALSSARIHVSALMCLRFILAGRETLVGGVGGGGLFVLPLLQAVCCSLRVSAQ